MEACASEFLELKTIFARFDGDKLDEILEPAFFSNLRVLEGYIGGIRSIGWRRIEYRRSLAVQNQRMDREI